MSDVVRVEDQVVYAYAAIQHLQHGRSLLDIAEELGVSRFAAGRMVQKARTLGLFEVRPRLAEPVDPDLSRALKDRFGLVGAFVVVAHSSRPEVIRSTIAGVAARAVSESIRDEYVVGLGSGRTIVEMCRQMSDVPVCDVVQLTGAANGRAEDSLEAIVTLSRVARGRMYPLHSPFVATEVNAARVISAQPSIREALRRIDSVQVAVLSIGGWPDSSLLADLYGQLGEQDELMRRGVVAEVGTTLLDAGGQRLPIVDERMIGISTRQLDQVPVVFGIGGGAGKERAVLAALRSGLVDVVVTDARIARLALEATVG